VRGIGMPRALARAEERAAFLRPGLATGFDCVPWLTPWATFWRPYGLRAPERGRLLRIAIV